MELPKWQALHAYDKLIDDGLADPITCPDAGSSRCVAIGKTITYKVGKDGDPVLYCMSCKTKIIPGMVFWDNVETALREAGVI